MSPKNIYINIMAHGLAVLVADPSDAVLTIAALLGYEKFVCANLVSAAFGKILYFFA